MKQRTQVTAHIKDSTFMWAVTILAKCQSEILLSSVELALVNG